MEDSLLQNTTFWTAVSFVLFIALIVWKGQGAIKKAVGGRIERIRDEIDQAESLKEEANKELAEMKKKLRDAETQADQIVEAAKKESKQMRSEADARFGEAMKRREQQAMDKIAQAEANAIREVQGKAVDMAVAAARSVIAGQMQGDAGAKAIDESINAVSQKLH